MTKRTLHTREWEEISAYLDGQLSEKSRKQFEVRLNQNEDLRQGLEEIRRTRTVIRQQAALRAPRNFTLTPAMLGSPPPASLYNSLASRMVTVLRTSAALASFLFVLVVVANVFLSRPASQTMRSVEKAIPEVAATKAMMQAPAAQVAPTETAGREMLAPYPEIPPEMEIPRSIQPFPPNGPEAGGVGGGNPAATGGPPLEAAPPDVLTEPYPVTEESPAMKEAPLAQDYASAEYPPPATGTPALEAPTSYPSPLSTQAVGSQESERVNLNLVAEILAILAISLGVAAFLINRSLNVP
jgi:hypothetical protein